MLKRYSILGANINTGGAEEYVLCSDLHFFDFSGDVLCYSPLIGSIYLMDRGLAERIRTGAYAPGEEGLLIKNEILVPKEMNLIPEAVPYKPLGIAIFMTSSCNLACRYCFANGGESHRSVQLDDVFAFIDTRKVIDFVSFHGGGEPTLEFEKIKKIVDYLHSRGHNPKWDISTNGVMAPEVIRYLVDNDFAIKISLDGQPEIQDSQRPSAGGQPTSSAIEATLAEMPPVKRWVQATVTCYNAEKQLSMLDYFFSRGIVLVKMEMVNDAGRAKTEGEYSAMPDSNAFIENFLKMKEMSDDINMYLESSLLTLGKRRITACDAYNPMVCLTPDGFLSSCFWASRNDKGYEPFIYGTYGKEGTVIDEEKVKALNRRTCLNLESCSSCFLRYTCAGGCFYDAYKENNDIFKPRDSTCSIRRELNEKVLRFLAERYIIRKKPYLESGSERRYIGAQNSFTEQRNMHIFSLDLKDTKPMMKKVLSLNNERKEPVLFLFSLHANMQARAGKDALDSFLGFLREKKVYHRMMNPVKRCYTDEAFTPVPYVPEGCRDCLEMYTVKDNKMYFCTGQEADRDFTAYHDRSEIFAEFKTKRRLDSRCRFCAHLHRGNCEGEYSCSATQ